MIVRKHIYPDGTHSYEWLQYTPADLEASQRAGSNSMAQLEQMIRDGHALLGDSVTHQP